MPDSPFALPPVAPPQTWRFTFAYRGDQVRLVSQQSVEMLTPAPATPSPQSGESGFWAELRDVNDASLSFRVLHDPFRAVIESYSPGPTPAIRPREVSQREGTFVVLLPAIPEARSVVLFGSPAEARATGQAARELARFPLAQTPPGGGNES
jgi:hypothetical protein